MEIHHGKHHAAYVANLNKAVVDAPDLAAMTPLDIIQNLDAVPEALGNAVRNNAGGHVNHTMFWEIMGPGGGGEPTGPLADAIAADLGGLTAAQEAVNAAGLGRFGSGWAWIVVGPDGKLPSSPPRTRTTPSWTAPAPPSSASMSGSTPTTSNTRTSAPTTSPAWWNVINWTAVSDRYAAAIG